MQYPKSKSFNKGMRVVAHGKYQALKSALMAAIGISSEPIWRKYRNGQTKYLDIEVAERIERTFAEYGVKQPWGE
ncbi:hypothetical protein [Alistipes senegalensis]|uniref:hypothetical protein n=1 Tax=Alistipes senegalensis TaxID=1288121 RepID=UPI0018AB0F69|nr:hypothetical protein [Alistipes senegalensis]